MAPSGSPCFPPASFRIRASAMFELIASDPPRRITAFPALKHSPAASAVTFGRDS